MVAKVPIRTVYTGAAATGLAEFQATEYIDYSVGGTGLVALGTANQVLATNSGATAIEWQDATTGDITGVTAGTGLSGGGTSGTVTVSIDTAVTVDVSTSQALSNKTFNQIDITAQGDLRLQDTTGGQYVALQAPGTVSTSWTATFPGAVGSSGQALRTSDGSGTLEWYTPETGDLTGITAGAGLTGGGTSGDVTVDAVGTADRITANANSLDIAATYVGQSSITTLGTIGTGTWQGTAVADAYVANDLTISGGTVNNSVIGGSTAAAGTFTQVDVEATGDLRLQDTTGGQYVALQAPGTVSTSWTATFPGAVGSSGQALRTSDGSGTLEWFTPEVGDITGVTAGAGLTGGGTSGTVTLDVVGGTGIDANANDIAIDSTVTTLTGSQTLTNKTLTTPVISSISNTGTITLPTSADTLVGRVTTDTLTNKTIDLDSNTVTGTLAEFNTALQSDDFVSLTGSETLTNKTLTSAVLNAAISGTSIKDEDNMASDSASHLATQQSIKAYVDATASGLDLKDSSHAATTANLSSAYDNGSSGVGATLTNNSTQAALTVDGQLMVAAERLLVKDQTAGLQNGIYTVTTVGNGSTNWVLTRSTDFDSPTEVTSGAFTFVETGTTNADSGWVLTTDGAVTIGTTALAFSQFSGAGQITAGTGLTKTGNTLDVDASQTQITAVGTIATGVWNGTAIANANLANSTVAYGGVSLSLGGSDTTPAFNLSDATAYPGDSSLVTTGTIATGTWQGTAVADAYIANDLTISGGTVNNSVIGGSTAAAGTFTQVDVEAQGDLRLQDTSGGQYVALQAPGTVSGSWTATLPAAVGSSGQALRTSDGSGTLEWFTPEVGDITGVTAGTGLSGGGTSGTVTLNVDASQTQITSVGTIGTGVWQGTAVADAYLGTGINAIKLANGSVTNAELQYINTLSSNAQTQIDTKATKGFSIAMGVALG